MFLFVILLISHVFNCSEPASSQAAASSGIVMTVAHVAENALCTAALSIFEIGAESVLSDYIKPYLTSVIREAGESPLSDDSPNHVSTVKRVLSGDLSVTRVAKKDMEELVFAAVQKTLQAKEKELTDKTSQIENMFTTKSTVGISTAAGIVLAVIGTLAGAFGTKSSC